MLFCEASAVPREITAGWLLWVQLLSPETVAVRSLGSGHYHK